MRVAIVAPSPVPFAPGGAEALWSGLYRELDERSAHDVELIKVPVLERTLPEVMAAYEHFAALDLTHFDAVISGKYPGWMVRHPHHVVYMLHPLRGLYDSYGLFGLGAVPMTNEPAVRRLLATAQDLNRDEVPELFLAWHQTLAELGPDHPDLAFPGPLARSLVHALDAAALAPAQVRTHAAISWTVAGRAEYFPAGVGVRVVHPPSSLQGLHQGPGEFFFTASRHDEPKRLDLLIEAMRHYPGDRQLLIAGGGPTTPRLVELAEADPRVRLVGRLAPEELVEHYAHAIAVPFVPVEEDLGLITYEALAAGKPVLTARDSGGPVEIVRPDLTGLVVEPTARSLGRGLAQIELLAADPAVAVAARASAAAMTWSRVVRTLLPTSRRAPARRRAREVGRPRLLVTSTSPVWPARGGGQLRAVNLYGALAERVDVDLVVLGGPADDAGATLVRPGLVEHRVPRSVRHQAADEAESVTVQLPVTDIVAARHAGLTPQYADRLAELAQGAQGVLLADPFLAPVVHETIPKLPSVYDAYNCEYVLKKQMLPDSPDGRRLLAEVAQVEGVAARRASLVLTVSEQDRAHISEHYGLDGSRFRLVPNGTDLSDVRYVSGSARAPRRDVWLSRLRELGGPQALRSIAVFVGSWHQPNIDAARALVDLAPQLPEVAFVLVGNHAEALRLDRLPANVLPLGEVSAAVKRDVLASADVALAPLLTGSGTNLKVVEYLASGVRVVSTPVGMRGIRVGGRGVGVATIDGFAAAIRAALCDTDDEARRRIAVQTRAAYDWRVLGAQALPQIMRALAEHSAQPAAATLRE